MKSLRDSGATVAYHGADLSIPEQIDDLVAETRRQFGHIDIVVNNAVTRCYANIEDLPVESWNYALAVNLSAPYHIVRQVMAEMKQRRWGRVLCDESPTTRCVERRGGFGLLGSTKHGLLQLTRAIALDGLDFYTTCAAVTRLRATLSRMRASWLSGTHMPAPGKTEEQATRDYLAQRQPSKRFVDPKDVGTLAAFLCSDGARHHRWTGGDRPWLARLFVSRIRNDDVVPRGMKHGTRQD